MVKFGTDRTSVDLQQTTDIYIDFAFSALDFLMSVQQSGWADFYDFFAKRRFLVR